ncbi:HAMP domain-containing protein [Sporichthya sp.]|uniref:hybrid sensor histidine kinase/response regulator n=1 Tax=Sporichthya sp. TaxID=65475 RepID=UPI0017BF3337|nr:HAMP domain-containing protein [Sporichthya sp.]MBA3742471.1 HAMP domain-containing protein [Sporichthya sp.]
MSLDTPVQPSRSTRKIGPDLSGDIADLLKALDSLCAGDFSVRLEPREGQLGAVMDRLNDLAVLNERRTRELVRASRVIGREGRMTERLDEVAADGDWGVGAEAINSLIDDLVRPTTEVARVIAAVAEGDLSQKMALEIAGQPVKGEFLSIGMTVNTMVDQLSSFADEVTRVAREVGTEGKLGGQAQVRGVSGVWRDLTESVNSMAGNLTSQVRNIAQVTTAVAQGDLSQKITVDAQGEILELKSTVNTMVDQLSSFADEVTRVAREVGTEGRLGGQAEVRGVSGTWRDLTDSVNSMAANLTDQVRNIAQVATAVARGDLSQKITVDAKGEVAALAQTLNTMVDQLSSFADEVTRVAREVGTEGKLGGQADVPGVGGTWKDLTDSVNSMAGNLTTQVRNIALIVTAVAQGDLSQKITVDAKGEVAALADTINGLTDTLKLFAEQVITVAREVGTEGKLGGQADVPGVAGTWKDLTDNVNGMAANLTAQVRDIAAVTTAVAQGDLSQKVSADAKGETLELKSTINTMVDQLSSFADEVTRVAREVGTEGKLGGQAQVRGVSGTWKDLTDNVNFMAGNLTGQVRNIAQVATAVAKGDLSQKITVDAQGEILELKNTLNTMVDQLSSFADEVTRVAREVGTEGRLGGQAQVSGVSGTWRDLTENVNGMAANLTSQVRNIAQVTTAVAQGDLSQKITVDAKGEVAALAQTINTMVDQLSSFADEVTRVAREVGTEGRLGGQAQVKGVSGTWRDLTDNVNYMAANLTGQVRNIAQVATAVAKGDLSQKINVDAQGEILELKSTVNTMVDQLSSFADEVTRVAREVGTEGKLGGQAQVKGISGTWRDLTDSVNFMASNLTSQVRNIALVTTAVAQGDLSQKITVDAQGEILELKSTVNTMVDQLSAFAAEVTRVAREVGTEGRLGGQAEVAGVSGTWRHLTENVNQLAGNLTTQVRAIAEVSTAVTRGDLTRSITVEASGEVAELKDNINQMIANLRSTTEINAQQDWLKSNLARIGGRMQGQRDLQAVTQMIMSEVTPVVEAVKGAFYLVESGDEGQALRLAAGYGIASADTRFTLGEGLVGQAAADKRSRRVRDIPPDYLPVRGGLGEARPADVLVLPVLFEEHVLGVIELASFGQFEDVHTDFLEQLVESIGVVLNTIIGNVRTEALLEQSQGLAQELQVQSVELQRTNAELEEKAEQLEMASQYKSEFLANMSHELRTPLNSLLILAQLLIDNPSSTLTAKEVEFARTIYSAGSDLLDLINDILDLSKVEAGKMELHPAPTLLTQLGSFVESSFGPLAQQKGLEFVVDIADGLPASITTDEQRLQQVVKNLLSNATKFTESGRVQLSMFAAPKDLWHSVPTLDNAETVLALSVSDTGVGVPAEKLGLIFEEFQQGDGTTSRKYGGTGLGLSISRNIIRLLGGAIAVESAEGVGSTFTIYVPAEFPFEVAESNESPVVTPVRLPKVPMLSRAVRAPIELGNDDPLRGSTVLIVDDDVRNVFALTSALEMHGMSVLYADNGRAGIELLEQHGSKVDLMLMDVMMPEMDGNETTAEIRLKSGFADLPILFLTAKAMPGDRDKSLMAGASDYITKPVDLDKLLTVMRSWLVSHADLDEAQ